MISNLENARDNFVDTIKLLIYKEAPDLLEKIYFDNDEIFLNPALFAYFNSKKENSFPKETLEEILQGFFLKEEKKQTKHSFNKNDIAYLPQLGYFKKGNENPYEPILIHGDFEIIKEVHPTIEKYFVEVYKGHVVNDDPQYSSVWKEHYKELCKAIDVIQEYLPEFYKELTFSNSKIYLHDNSKILNFTSVETLGMLFFYVFGDNNLIYFIEELIHQGSHNFLYYVVHERKAYFRIDVENQIMRNFTKQDWDYRSIYGAFHGLFTVTQRVECFDKLLSQNVFSGREKHELLGRLTDQFTRFRTGLELLNLNEIFAEEGVKLYNQLDKKCESILLKYDKLRNEFDLSNRDLDFRYDDFCKLNSYEEFLKKDKNGFFEF